MHRIPTTDLGFARERTFNGTFHDINGISQPTMSDSVSGPSQHTFDAVADVCYFWGLDQVI
jgi:hypothetical protein